MSSAVFWSIFFVFMAAIVTVVVLFFVKKSETTCGVSSYDPATQQCINNAVCENSDVCGSGDSASCCSGDNICNNGTCYAGYYCGKNDDGFPLCQLTTDPAKAAYSGLGLCQAAGCRFQPVDCYYDEVKKFVDDNAADDMASGQYGRYIWVAVYGMNSTNCASHSDYTFWEGTKQSSNPTINLWKCAGVGYERDCYLCTENEYNGKTYYFDINVPKDSNCELLTEAVLSSAVELDAACDSCDSKPSGTDVTAQFSVAAYPATSSDDTDDGNGYPAIVIIVPTDDQGSSCLETYQKPVNSVKKTLAGVF